MDRKKAQQSALCYAFHLDYARGSLFCFDCDFPGFYSLLLGQCECQYTVFEPGGDLFSIVSPRVNVRLYSP